MYKSVPEYSYCSCPPRDQKPKMGLICNIQASFVCICVGSNPTCVIMKSSGDAPGGLTEGVVSLGVWPQSPLPESPDDGTGTTVQGRRRPPPRPARSATSPPHGIKPPLFNKFAPAAC